MRLHTHTLTQNKYSLTMQAFENAKKIQKMSFIIIEIIEYMLMNQ